MCLFVYVNGNVCYILERIKSTFLIVLCRISYATTTENNKNPLQMMKITSVSTKYQNKYGSCSFFRIFSYFFRQSARSLHSFWCARGTVSFTNVKRFDLLLLVIRCLGKCSMRLSYFVLLYVCTIVHTHTHI